MYACAAEDSRTQLWGGEAPWRHDRRWILAGATVSHGGARLLGTAPLSQEYRDLLVDLDPDGVYGEGAGHTVGLAPQRRRESR